MKSQRIRDPIHDLISFSPKSDEAIWQLLQTTPMQRLRRVKQLGFSEFVYPGATHTRFSHALGAMQMARRMLAAFERTDVIGASGTNP
jgi:HD superfamily phosphohydrolase